MPSIFISSLSVVLSNKIDMSSRIFYWQMARVYVLYQVGLKDYAGCCTQK